MCCICEAVGTGFPNITGGNSHSPTSVSKWRWLSKKTQEPTPGRALGSQGPHASQWGASHGNSGGSRGRGLSERTPRDP